MFLRSTEVFLLENFLGFGAVAPQASPSILPPPALHLSPKFVKLLSKSEKASFPNFPKSAQRDHSGKTLLFQINNLKNLKFNIQTFLLFLLVIK